MVARIGWAVGTAILGGFWLVFCLRQGGRVGRTGRTLQALAFVLAGFWSVVWLALAFARIRYPFELEWCGGAMLDHCKRVLAGQPLYVAPNPEWFPYEYPPLYTWVCAGLMRVAGGPSFAPMRAVSIVATVVSAGLIVVWARTCLSDCAGGAEKRGGRGGVWGLLAAGVFLASYRFTGAWYDIERLDMLFLALSLLGGWLLTLAVAQEDGQPRGNRLQIVLAAGAGVALWLAFLTKQQAVLFVLAGVAALVLLRRWREAGVFAAVCVGLSAASVAMLNASSKGWFWYYCFHLPAANGIKWHLAGQFVFGDLPLFAPMLALLAAPVVARQPGGGARRSPCGVVLAAFTVFAVLGSLLSRAHWGGDQNVLIPAFAFLALAGCVAAARIEGRVPWAMAPLCALVLAQMVALTYRPAAQLTSPRQRAAGARFEQLVADLGRDGEVLVMDHGGFSVPAHFHTMALHDVFNADRAVPPSLVRALRAHRYTAVITDARPVAEGAYGDLVREYPVARPVGIAETWTATGFPTPSPERVVWVSRPAPAGRASEAAGRIADRLQEPRGDRLARERRRDEMAVARFIAPAIECDGCAGAIKRSLGKLPGVASVDVSVADKRVDVNYDPAVTSVSAISERLATAGYPAQTLSS